MKKLVAVAAVSVFALVGCVNEQPNEYGGMNEAVPAEEERGSIIYVYDSSDILKCSYLVRDSNPSDEQVAAYNCEDGQGFYDD